MSPQLTCVHRCQCGAQLECGDPDRCPIGSRVWLCDACELDELKAQSRQRPLRLEA